MQKPTFADLQEYVLASGERLYNAFERSRPLLDPARFVELRYEDLARDPLGQVERIYSGLGLSGFAQASARMRARVDSLGPYRAKPYQLAPELRRELERRWAVVFERYGY